MKASEIDLGLAFLAFCAIMCTGEHIMNGTSTFTIRVSSDIKHRLDKLAKAIKRTRSWLAADAVENYVAEQERHLVLIEQAERAIEAGRSVPHEEVARWLLSWGTDHELPPLTCK